ncbi:hypothetical protein [Streptomyces bohaiensis]|uniref:hypothetical protein n=1 Tax=Streptomyces bohaiensis TaxID=1431344 RepID=UPI003B76DD2A
MFAAHLLAALLSGVWLAFGERAAHQILRAVIGWLFGPLALALARAPLPCAAHIAPGFRRPRPLRRCFLSFCVVLRGPPVGAAVA